MTKKDHAKELIAKSKYKMGLTTVLKRMREGWSDERIINTRTDQFKNSHPFRSASYAAMTERKEGKHD